MRSRSTLVFLLAIGSLLGACHKSREPAPDNQAVVIPAPVQQAQTPEPEPLPEPTPKPVPPKPKAAPKPTADQQMLDDADATGMTSHVSQDTGSSDSSGTSDTAGNNQL